MTLRLAIALDGAGWHPSAPSHPEAQAPRPTTASWWTQVVREADQGPFELVTIADSHRRAEDQAARLDATMIAARVAPLTRTVGLLPAVSTTISEPFLVSTQIATLDYLSGGRAGVEITVSTDPADAGYVGPRAVVPPAERTAEAREYVEVVRALWDSWQDDAEIRDASSHRFIDRARIRHINFRGRYLSIDGPSITPRPPQGQPLIAARAQPGVDHALAAAVADLALVSVTSVDEIPAGLEAVRRSAEVDHQRPAPLCLIDAAVFLDPTHTSAQRRRARLDAQAGQPDWPGLVFTGTARELAGWLGELSELGCDGVRLHPATIPYDLYGLTRELPAHLAALTGADEGQTLRQRLGLPRPANRFLITA